MKTLALATTGLLLNTLVLLAPEFLLGEVALMFGDRAIVAFFALASLFCACDLTTLWIQRPRRNIAEETAADRAARRLAFATGVALLVGFWLGLFEHAHAGRDSYLITMLFGGGLMLLGCLLRLTSILTLGSQFRTEVSAPIASRLVRHGVYRIMRHPSETGLLAVALGAAVLLGSFTASLVWLVVLAPLVFCRLSLEERQLVARYGARYQRYRRRVRRLIPLVY